MDKNIKVFNKRKPLKFMKRNKFLFASIFIFLITLVGAVQTFGVFKQNDCIDLIQTCDNCTYVNITSILYPNSSQLMAQDTMAKVGTTYIYGNVCNTSVLGKYIVNTLGDADGSDTISSYDFEITPSGVSPTTAQSGLSLGIIISIVCIMFFFGFLAFKFMDYENLSFLSLFFLVLSIIIAVYGFYLGFVYSRDYLYASTSSPQGSLFTSILLGLAGITLITMTIFTFKVIGGLKIKRQEERRGEGWDSRSQSYQ